MPRLRPVADILEVWLAGRTAVPETVMTAVEAAGLTLAAPVRLSRQVPPIAFALVDGVAVIAAETIGASPYSPTPLSAARPVRAGEPVALPFDAVIAGGGVEGLNASCPAAPGDGLRRRGEDAAAGALLGAAGAPFPARASALAVLAGIAAVVVRRPVVHLGAGPNIADGTVDLLAGFLRAEGCAVRIAAIGATVAAASADVHIWIGSAAIGASDPALAAARAAPGWRDLARPAARRLEDAVAGTLSGRPSLVLPARPDALLVAGLLLLRPVIDRLAGREPRRGETRPLGQKIASPVGLSDLVLLGDADGGRSWGPLPADLSGLAAATHWCVLPPGSEGHAAAEPLAAAPLPPGF